MQKGESRRGHGWAWIELDKAELQDRLSAAPHESPITLPLFLPPPNRQTTKPPPPPVKELSYIDITGLSCHGGSKKSHFGEGGTRDQPSRDRFSHVRSLLIRLWIPAPRPAVTAVRRQRRRRTHTHTNDGKSFAHGWMSLHAYLDSMLTCLPACLPA